MHILAGAVFAAALLALGAGVCRMLRLPAGAAPLCGLALGMVGLQLLGSANLLLPGALLFWGGAVLSAVVLLRQSGVRHALCALAEPGVLAFCVAVAVLMVVFAVCRPTFQTWDEFSHWGVYFKSVFYSRQLALWDTARSLAHPAYPQGLAALYMPLALLCGAYSETDLLFLTALPLAAAAAMLFCVPRARGVLWGLCAGVAAPPLFWLFAADTPYTTAYMDAPVGAMLAAGLLLCVLPCEARDRVRRGFAVALAAGAAATVKEIGAVFALCILGVWFCQCAAAAVRRAGGVRTLLLPFCAALPALAVPALWRLALVLLGRENDQFSSMGAGYFLQCLREARTGDDPYFYEVWARYYARFRTYPLLFGASTFKLGCLCAVAAVVLAAALCRVQGRRQGLHTALPALCMIVYWPLYHAVLFFVYICGMSAYEALEMASWQRYFCCFFIGWFAVLAGECFALTAALAPRLAHLPARRLCAAAPACALVALSLFGYVQAGGVEKLFCLPADEQRAEQVQSAAALYAAMSGDAQGTVWILSADADTASDTRWRVQYDLYPALCAVNAPTAQDGVDLAENTERYNVHWLVLFGVSEDFAARYAACADDGLAAAQGTEPALYAVCRTGDTVQLTLQSYKT